MFRVVQCEMDGDEVARRTVIESAVATTEQAEARAAAASHGYPQSGFDGQRGFWWACSENGTWYRFYVEVSEFDETDGV